MRIRDHRITKWVIAVRVHGSSLLEKCLCCWFENGEMNRFFGFCFIEFFSKLCWNSSGYHCDSGNDSTTGEESLVDGEEEFASWVSSFNHRWTSIFSTVGDSTNFNLPFLKLRVFFITELLSDGGGLVSLNRVESVLSEWFVRYKLRSSRNPNTSSNELNETGFWKSFNSPCKR